MEIDRGFELFFDRMHTAQNHNNAHSNNSIIRLTNPQPTRCSLNNFEYTHQPNKSKGWAIAALGKDEFWGGGVKLMK